jgi:Uma2 family endonuclease
MPMSSVPIQPDASIPGPIVGQPAWELALLYPLQGEWGDYEYLAFTAATNRLIELADGRIEILPMPTSSHQRILLYLYTQLQAFILPSQLGEALCAPLRVKIQDGKFREPDVVFMLEQHRARMGEDFWEGADLVMEVVSPDPESRKRDLQQKPLDYAAAGIPEYWIIDPEEKRITVLVLNGDRYQKLGEFGEGETASSALLSGFAVDVSEVWRSARR